MSKRELLIKAVTVQGLSYGEAARHYRVSKSLIHKLHHRWLEEGEAALEPRSRRPASSPNRTPDAVRERVLELRRHLDEDGLDSGADTICAHLERAGVTISRTTVWRILTAAGNVTPQPQKRPRSSWKRFAAERPNELWQSDFTHWTLADDSEVEIIGWLDDHSRKLLHLTAHHRVTGRTVSDSFTTAATTYGYPTATLTDNGMVYTTRHARSGPSGRDVSALNAFETLLHLHGITQKNGRPYKPTTQGKIERFWQTLKKHLKTRPATTIAEVQAILNTFRDYYNSVRPHRGIGRKTPDFAYQLIPKATPTPPEDPDIWRVRYDTVDHDGKITLRHHGRLLHLGIGRAHNRTDVICLVHNNDATVITHDGEILGDYTLNPEKSYQPKNG